MNNIQKYFLIFVSGGVLILTIHIIANIVKNPGIAAIVSLIPISIFCCYIMETREILNSYMRSLIYVFCISLLLIIVGYFLASRTNIDQKMLVTGLIVSWFILQLLIYAFYTHRFSQQFKNQNVNNTISNLKGVNNFNNKNNYF